MYKRILVPTDGSDASDRAVHTAISLARALGATLYTVSVSEPFAVYAGLAEAPMFPPDGSAEEQQRRAQGKRSPDGVVAYVKALCKPGRVATAR
jgi:nucleotide-binding universal stress UspA family protein